MKQRVRKGGVLAAVLGTVAVSAAFAWAPFPFRPESRLWVEGTSTVRGFTCEAGTLIGKVDPAPGVTTLAVPALGEAVRSMEVTVPVEALDCGNGTMNNHLFKALKGQDHPAVRFRLSSYEVAPKGSSEATVKLAGELEMAGQERPITLEGLASAAADGSLRVRGKKEIRMTEFGVKPPSLMMGTMKVGDRVNVHFDVVLKP